MVKEKETKKTDTENGKSEVKEYGHDRFLPIARRFPA